MAGIYIHIPFCHSKCAYCDFFSTPADSLREDYVDAVIEEYAIRRNELTEPVKTIYIGGGTPSILPTHLLDRLIHILPSDGIEEFTIEVNPEDVTEEFSAWLAGSPIGRVSMGIQSFDDTTLKAIGRRHTGECAMTALERLRRSGCDVSCDLIYGLPGQTLRSWNDSLRKAIDFRPAHLSCYLLSYELGTRLTAMLNAGKIKETDEATIGGMYASLCESTSAAGYEHYEVSNFSLRGHRARHNSSYWNLTPYLGLGTGAHSFDGTVRRYNRNDIKGYVACRSHGFTTVDPENESERYNDFLMVSLRTADGLDLEKLRLLFGERRAAAAEQIVRRLVHEGKMELTAGQRYRICESEWLVSDSIIIDFIEV